jgi:transcriptional regulator with XRE-family HTH domain
MAKRLIDDLNRSLIDPNSIAIKANESSPMIMPSQIRAARALLGLSQWELADLAGIGAATVKRIEAASEIRGSADTFWKIQRALETAGVEFIPADEAKGPGVRLKDSGLKEPKRPRKRSKRKGAR